MPNIGFDKLFSEEEANELIPRLEILMRQLQMQATSLRARIDELSVDDPSIVHSAMSEIVGRYPELRSFATNMADAAAQIESFGCILKDIDLGLIDFPVRRGRRSRFPVLAVRRVARRRMAQRRLRILRAPAAARRAQPMPQLIATLAVTEKDDHSFDDLPGRTRMLAWRNCVLLVLHRARRLHGAAAA